MNTLISYRLSWHFRDRDRAAARARLEALDEALQRRGVPTFLAECGLHPGHVIALQCGGRDGVVILALRREDGTYEAEGRGNPPGWLLAHLERAWCEIA